MKKIIKNYDYYSDLLSNKLVEESKNWKYFDILTEEEKDTIFSFTFNTLLRIVFNEKFKSKDDFQDQRIIKELVRRSHQMYVKLAPETEIKDDSWKRTICKSELLKRENWNVKLVSHFNLTHRIVDYKRYKNNGTMHLYNMNKIREIEESEEFKQMVKDNE